MTAMGNSRSVCGVCGGQRWQNEFEAPDTTATQRYQLMRCVGCGTVWTLPQPDSKTLEHAYQADYYGGARRKFTGPVERWTRFAAARRARRLSRHQAALAVLDIGCGRGVLLDALDRLGHDAKGIERARAGFDEHPLIETVGVERARFDRASFDLIVLIHVLEHLVNPKQTLADCADWVKCGGDIVVTVPNFDAVQRQLFGKYWFHLDLPRHLTHFSRPALQRLLHDCGFQVVAIDTWALDQSLFGFVQSALNCVPGLPTNHLYSLLMSNRRALRWIKLLPYVLPLAVLMPFAICELLISFWCGRGSVLNVRARRCAR